MAYTREYPNNITPLGSKTKECLTNDDLELKRILNLFSEIGGGLKLFGSKRQCVLYGETDSSGNPAYLAAAGLNVSIDGNTKPVILSFANGFSSTEGTLDVIDSITIKVSTAWTIPASGTYYLYIERDMSTNLISYGYTATADTYGKVAPSSPVLDQCYFNTNEMKMYRYNGSAWEQKLRIFVASVTTSATVATVTPYPMTSKAAPVGSINLLGRGNAYAAGDMKESESLPSWAVLECTTAGTSASTEPSFSGVQVGSTVKDGTVTWTVRHRQDGHRINDIWMTSGTFDSNGYLIDATLKTARLDVHLCDGNLGTPNLANKFIMGSASIGGTGGANSLVLTTENMPSHTHGASAWSDSQGAHHHGSPFSDDSSNGPYGLYDGNKNHLGSDSTDCNNPIWNTSTDGAHSHNIGVSIGATGGNAAFDNRPEFYTLAFVKKIK